RRGSLRYHRIGMGTLMVERLAEADYAQIKPLLVDLHLTEQAHYADHPQLSRFEIEDHLASIPNAFRGENVIFVARDDDGSVIGFCWVVLHDPGTGGALRYLHSTSSCAFPGPLLLPSV